MNRRICIANWKLFLPGNTALQWAHQHAAGLHELTQKADIVICPESPFIFPLRSLFNQSIGIGGQDCSAALDGAYTGQISAHSLHTVGAQYCIVGHSECRKYLHETALSTAKKVQQLLSVGITPIVCTGEDIASSLMPLASLLEQKSGAHVHIAYEPEWAIGGNSVPGSAQLQHAQRTIADIMNNHLPNISYTLLYGGSVNEQTVVQIEELDLFDGYLIGRASTDFQTLKKIVWSF